MHRNWEPPLCPTASRACDGLCMTLTPSDGPFEPTDQMLLSMQYAVPVRVETEHARSARETSESTAEAARHQSALVESQKLLLDAQRDALAILQEQRDASKVDRRIQWCILLISTLALAATLWTIIFRK